MEESIKKRITLILAILTAILFIGTINSCINVSRLRSELNKEKDARFDLEKGMGEFNKEKAAVEDKLKNFTQALEEEKAGHQATQKALLQEQLVNQSLKEELLKVTRLKEALEQGLLESKPAKSK